MFPFLQELTNANLRDGLKEVKDGRKRGRIIDGSSPNIGAFDSSSNVEKGSRAIQPFASPNEKHDEPTSTPKVKVSAPKPDTSTTFDGSDATASRADTNASPSSHETQTTICCGDATASCPDAKASLSFQDNHAIVSSSDSTAASLNPYASTSSHETHTIVYSSESTASSCDT